MSAFERVCEVLREGMERLRVPGGVVGIAHDGEEEIAGFGVTSVDNPLPVSPETLFQIGSITKTFVGTAVMRLVEPGKLDLDAPVRRYLPALRLQDEAAASAVTMRHLLTHTGGWVGDYFNDFGAGDDALATMVSKVEELPQLTPLGEVWSYNNSGFYLAGRVIEVTTVQPFESALHQLVLDPLGLKNSYFFAHEVITKRFAVGHQVSDNEVKVAEPWAIGRAAHPAGGLICSAADLLRYAQFHMGDGTTPDGERLLSADSLQAMRTAQAASEGDDHVGITWFLSQVGRTRIAQHGGGTNGQITLLRIVPERNFAVVVFTNGSVGGRLTSAVADSALKEFLGIERRLPEPTPTADARLDEYRGRYETAGGTADIEPAENALVIKLTPKGGFPTPDSPPGPTPPPMRAAFYAVDRFVVTDPPMGDMRGSFLRDGSGQIEWMRLGGRIARRS